MQPEPEAITKPGALVRYAAAVPALLAASLALVPSPARACGACGCTLHTDWASQGFAVGTGFHLDLRYDWFNQDQLRAGTGTVDRGAIGFPTNREIQQQTINRNTMLGLDWSPSVNWGVNVQIPLFDRTHETIAPGDTGPSSQRSAGLGDIRVVGRYQGFAKDHSFGVLFGVKLPTGRTRDRFIGGPQVGEPVDRGLQLGTGTTDLLLGAYKFGSFAPSWEYFAQVLFQIPANSRDDYRPGNGLNLNVGLRYSGFRGLVPQLQVNVRAEKPESGLNADRENSGATLAYLSPGCTFRVSYRLRLSVFIQVPIYQRVTGYQIEPRFLASLGLHYAF